MTGETSSFSISSFAQCSAVHAFSTLTSKYTHFQLLLISSQRTPTELIICIHHRSLYPMNTCRPPSIPFQITQLLSRSSMLFIPIQSLMDADNTPCTINQTSAYRKDIGDEIVVDSIAAKDHGIHLLVGNRL